MVYGHFALSHDPLDIETPLAQTITSLPMCQMCQPPSSYSRSNFVAWDTESYFATYTSENTIQLPPPPSDLLLMTSEPSWSTCAMYRALSPLDCTTHGVHA